MNKVKLCVLSLVFLAIDASANVIINGTRVIYNEGNKGVTVQLINNGDSPSLVQSWLDAGDESSTPETADVPFVLSPPVAKVPSRSGQQLRIRKLSTPLATDRESLFYLNVLDIPAVDAEKKGKNLLQMALRSRIKLFYRPASLSTSPTGTAYQKIRYQQNGNQLTLINNSPYYFTIASISLVNRKGPSMIEPTMVPPFGLVSVPIVRNIDKTTLQVTYVDDFGAFISRPITLS